MSRSESTWGNLLGHERAFRLYYEKIYNRARQTSIEEKTGIRANILVECGTVLRRLEELQIEKPGIEQIAFFYSEFGVKDPSSVNYIKTRLKQVVSNLTLADLAQR